MLYFSFKFPISVFKPDQKGQKYIIYIYIYLISKTQITISIFKNLYIYLCKKHDDKLESADFLLNNK